MINIVKYMYRVPSIPALLNEKIIGWIAIARRKRYRKQKEQSVMDIPETRTTLEKTHLT